MTYFVYMLSGHSQRIEGVKDVAHYDNNYIFYDDNNKDITCVPAANMAFYTRDEKSVTQLGVL